MELLFKIFKWEYFNETTNSGTFLSLNLFCITRS